MKISHIAAKKELLDIMTVHVDSSTALFKYVLLNQSINLSNPDLTDADIVHIHGLAALEEEITEKIIVSRLSEKKAVILSLTENDLRDISRNEQIYKQRCNLIQECSAVFIHDSILINQLELLPNWVWAPLPVSSLPALENEERFENKQNFRILYLTNSENDNFYSILKDNILKLKDEGYQFECNIITDSEKYTDEQICELINETDIFIDNPALPAISINSLKALSKGKTVLASIPDNITELSRHLEFIPILKTNPQNLHYRLSSLAKQPKCLRDFGRRGIQYMNTHHKPEEVIQGYLDIYRQYI